MIKARNLERSKLTFVSVGNFVRSDNAAVNMIADEFMTKRLFDYIRSDTREIIGEISSVSNDKRNDYFFYRFVRTPTISSMHIVLEFYYMNLTVNTVNDKHMRKLSQATQMQCQ